MLALTYQLEGMFIFYSLNNNIWFIALYFSISLDGKVPDITALLAIEYINCTSTEG